MASRLSAAEALAKVATLSEREGAGAPKKKFEKRKPISTHDAVEKRQKHYI
jgi:hypothetical protein